MNCLLQKCCRVNIFQLILLSVVFPSQGCTVQTTCSTVLSTSPSHPVISQWFLMVSQGEAQTPKHNIRRHSVIQCQPTVAFSLPFLTPWLCSSCKDLLRIPQISLAHSYIMLWRTPFPLVWPPLPRCFFPCWIPVFSTNQFPMSSTTAHSDFIQGWTASAFRSWTTHLALKSDCVEHLFHLFMRMLLS